jgi:hypothetical protein
MRTTPLIVALLLGSAAVSFGQADSKASGAKDSMPNRISMNVTVPKQTQGATFGEKSAAPAVEGECILQFSNQQAFRVSSATKTATELGADESAKVNAGLQAAGGALAQGASLLGGALPGGAILSAAFRRADGGKPVWETQNPANELKLPAGLPDGAYELRVSLRTVEKGAAKIQARFGILLQGATFKVTPAKG